MSVHRFVCGGIDNQEARVVKDRVEIREYLHVTVLVDHDVIDGAGGAGSLKLVRMVESGMIAGKGVGLVRRKEKKDDRIEPEDQEPYFSGYAEEAVNFYVSLFPGAKILK